MNANIKDRQGNTPWKSEVAYKERQSVCYISEQGTPSTHATFLHLANGEELVANQLFDGCYWQEPELLLVEEQRGAQLRLPRLSRHTKSNMWWLRFYVSPNEEQCSNLKAQGWREQAPILWAIESENEALVPEGIAFVHEGQRDRTPQEEDAFRKELAREDGLTPQARTERVAFEARVTASMCAAAQKVCYVIDQIPNDTKAWAAFEQVNGRGIRTLFLSQIAENEETLWQALDRLPPTCSFTITQLERLKSCYQVKGNRRHGDIMRIIAREEGSSLVLTIEQVSLRINQEAPRDRLLRRWREQNGVRAERIKEEIFHLEALPTLSELYPKLYPNLAEQQTSIFEAIIRLESVQKTYEETIQQLNVLPANLSVNQITMLIVALEDKYQQCIAQQQEGVCCTEDIPIPQGRAFAYQQLAQNVREWLLITQDSL